MMAFIWTDLMYNSQFLWIKVLYIGCISASVCFAFGGHCPLPFLQYRVRVDLTVMDTCKQWLRHTGFIKLFIGILERGMLDFNYENNFVVLLLKQWSVFICNNEHYSWTEMVFPKAPYWIEKVTKGSVIIGDVRFMLLSGIKMKPNWLL